MPQTYEIVSLPELKIGGQNAPEAVYDGILSIEADQSLLLPSMVSVRLLDPRFDWADSNIFELGKLIGVGLRYAEEQTATRVFSGEITAVELDGTAVVIRGYDKSHRLNRGKKTRTFLDMSDSDIASRIAGECNLTPRVDSTGMVHEYVCQHNQTNMEFLRDMAQRNGYRLYVEDDTLYFVKTPSSSNVPTLEWGVNLIGFQARLTTAEQVNKVTARSWDPKKKTLLAGDSAAAPNDTPQVGESRSGGQVAQRAFGEAATIAVTNRPVNTANDAKTMAQSAYDEISNAFIQAEGTCAGNPKVCAGTMVEIKGVGNRFSGRYRVTRAIHRYEKSGQYTTWFEISGRRANTLGQLLATPERSGYGVVVGVVTNADDPEGLARVKVKFPTLVDEKNHEVESCWARLVSPMAGSSRGFEFIPEVNDEVLVAFEYDDIHRPFILGALWNSTDKPPEPTDKIVSGGKVQKRIIRSRSGHIITLDDTDGGEKITVVDKTGNNSLEIDSKNNSVAIHADKKIEIQTKGGHKIVIEDQSRKIDIVSGNNSIKIDSAQNSISIESAMKLNLKAQTIQIEGTNMTIKSQAAMNIESAMTTMKGTGVLTLQGGLVKIN